MLFKKDNSSKRFITTHHEDGCKILVDKETGINYLYSWDGYSGGITPLLNKDGKPIITEIDE